MANEQSGVVFLLSKDGETLLVLDATEEISYSRSASLSENTLQSGVKVSDHYHPDLPTVTFSGLISDSKIRDTSPSVKDYRRLIEELIDSATPFTLYGTWDGSIPSLDNCVILNFDAVKGSGNLNSLQVVITVKQIDFGMRAELDSITAVTIPAKSTEGQLAKDGDVKTGTKTGIDPVSGLAYTQLNNERILAGSGNK